MNVVAIYFFALASQQLAVYAKEVVDYDDSDMERLFQQWEVRYYTSQKN